MKNILLLDSGSGGINILAECVKRVKYGNFLFFCDNKNLPYGDKDNKILLELTYKNLEFIKTFFDFDIVIFACNTLTSVCLDECRKKYPNITFIGTVPAVNLAIKKYDEKDILVLATGVTLKYNSLLSKNHDFKLVNMDGLASLIDENLDDLSKLDLYFERKLPKISPKSVVLGCTHYSSVKPMIQSFYGENVEIFDSCQGVANRLKSFVGDELENFKIQIMLSGNQDFRMKLIYHLNKLLKGGI